MWNHKSFRISTFWPLYSVILDCNSRDCYNIFDKRWYNFDDEYVSQLREISNISNSAYVLFYIKQNDRNHVGRIIKEKFE